MVFCRMSAALQNQHQTRCLQWRETKWDHSIIMSEHRQKENGAKCKNTEHPLTWLTTACLLITAFSPLFLLIQKIKIPKYSKSPTCKPSSCQLSKMRTCIHMSRHISNSWVWCTLSCSCNPLQMVMLLYRASAIKDSNTQSNPKKQKQSQRYHTSDTIEYAEYMYCILSTHYWVLYYTILYYTILFKLYYWAMVIKVI